MFRTKFPAAVIVFATAIPFLGQTVLREPVKPVGSFPGAGTPCNMAPADKVKLPEGASQDWWSKAQEYIRQDEYTFVWQDASSASGKESSKSVPAGWIAPNRAQGFTTRFSETGFVASPWKEGACWKWGLSLAAWGRPGAMQAVGKAALNVETNRLTTDRPGITESFLNDDHGLEQAFTIQAMPPGSGVRSEESGVAPPDASHLTPHELYLDLALAGTLHPRLDENGQAVDFYDNGNVSVIHYAQLKATDATGRVLPSRFQGWDGSSPSSLISHPSSSFGGIRIAIDDSNAVYPITVDPLATSPAWTAVGETAGDKFGISVATAGDVNGDGYSDVLVGAYGYSGNTGKAYLYLGSASGPSVTSSWTATGEAAGNYFGISVGTAGDANGDGYSDVIIGASGNNSYTGKAYVYLGRPGPVGLPTTASWTKTGESTSDNFGYCVATAGDVNGDGYSDVVIGAPGRNSHAGKAYVFLGSETGLSGTSSWSADGPSGSNYGNCVATAGDVNGDGYSDVLVGAYKYTATFLNLGRAYLYLGGASGLSSTASWIHNGVRTGDDYFGNSLTTAGDVNGDGYSDVIIGAPETSNGPGYACLFLGGASGLSANPAQTISAPAPNNDDQFATSVSTAGDINGDGYADVIIGAPRIGYCGDEGTVYLYLGSSSGLGGAVWSATGVSCSAQRMGTAVAAAGDVNGDGFSDVIIGSPNWTYLTGQACVYLGGAGGLSSSPKWTNPGVNASDLFGLSLATAGDVDGDGYSDVLIGAPGFNSSMGKAYLFPGGPSGLSSTPSWSATGENAGDQFGFSVASAGDIDGDGYFDVVIGAQGCGSHTGKAYAYTGGVSGLSATPSWTMAGETAGSYFGCSVACAEDVNGDGFSDVVIGADGYSSSMGKAYVYPGSPWGLAYGAYWTATGESAGDQFGHSVAAISNWNAQSGVLVGAPLWNGGRGKTYQYAGQPSPLVLQWTATGENAGDQFGSCVASAGDVNGDGFSDVIVGAPGYNSSTGKAYAYLGSSGGIGTSAAWTQAGESAGDGFGYSVATAGDVNGDGASDVILGAYNNNSGTGKAYLYLGGASGLAASSSWSAVGETTSNLFGSCVAPAGDVNGDGFSDVIVGTPGYSGNTGKAYLYYGNGLAGIPVRPQQMRSDLSAPIAPLGRADASGQFQTSSLVRTPFGRGGVKLEWQVTRFGGDFLPSHTPFQTGTTWFDSGTGGAALANSVSLTMGNNPYVWRMRAKYNLAALPFQGHGPWFALPAKGLMETDLRLMPACNLPTLACSITAVTKNGTSCTLTRTDPNPSNARTGWNVRRSSVASSSMDSWPIMGSNISPSSPTWTDASGDVSPTGVWFYEVTSYNSNCPAEGPF